MDEFRLLCLVASVVLLSTGVAAVLAVVIEKPATNLFEFLFESPRVRTGSHGLKALKSYSLGFDD